MLKQVGEPREITGRTVALAATDRLAALAADAARGSPDALRTLLVSVTPALLRAVRGVLGVGHPECEDVAQEAAIALVQALPAFRRECTVLHFACRIAVLTSLAARRRMRVRGEGLIDELAADHASDALEEDPVISARRRNVLRELCDQLPDSQSEALILHCVLGFTVEEIADAVAVPHNTVRSRLRLAKQALRARLAADPALAARLEVER
jgi:RNA polymerase sigma factor (sigma-70 family)